MNRTQPRSPLASAIKQALVVGLTVTPLLAAPVHAQNTTSANDAVKAAAEAAHAAADAAKAAAEAALVAAEAARSAVEAANGIPPTPRQVREPAAPALQELPLRDNRSVGVPTTPAPVATAAAATAPAVAAAAIAPVLSRGAEAATAAMVITRREIEASGQTLLSEFIRDTAANTNGSFRQSSDNLSQSQSVARLRGLDANNTVVLIDGKRMAGSPTFDAGSASNLNVIPMAAVERIEILSEGASALYGDSAIGGAINIITRGDMEGFSFSATAGRPSREGGDEQAAAVTGAVRSDRGSISFALDHAEQDLVFNADRDYSAVGLSSFGFPGSFFASGPNGESLGTFPDPRCPASDGTGVPSGEGEFPDSVVLGTRCRYNYAGVSANEASLSRTSLFVNGEFELTDSVDAFGRVIFSSTESMGRIAPTPQVGGSPFLPTMSAANPNNPTNPANVTNANGDDLTPFHNLGGLTGPFDLSIFYRNVPGGFRDTVVDDQLLDVVAGVRTDSERMGGVSFEVTAQHSEHTSDSTTNGLASRSALQQAIDDGSYDIFGVNGPTDPAIAQSIARTATVDAKTEYDALRAEVTLNGLRVGAASLPVRFGAQTANESYGIDYDSLSNAGLLDGTAGGDDVSGDRRISSVYGGATLNLGRRLQVDGQLRTDDYDASGSANSQRLAASLALVPGVTLHGSASRGFRAPTLAQLNAGTAQSFNGAIDVTSCAQASPGSVDENGNVIDPQGSACVSTQYQNLLGGNPELSLESSTAWTAGVTLEPGDDLRLSVTAYSIEIEDQVGTSTLQQILANEFVNGGSDLVERDANGNIVQILNNNQNVGSTRTSGMSLDATAGAYRTGLGPGARLSANYIREIERETIPGAGFARSPGVFEPNLRANLDLLWRFTDDVELVVNGNYVGETSFTDQSSSLDAWLTWDAQLQVEFPWQGSLAVGARNLFDEDPPTDPGLGNPFYRNQLHNPYGIVPYVRYTQEL